MRPRQCARRRGLRGCEVLSATRDEGRVVGGGGSTGHGDEPGGRAGSHEVQTHDRRRPCNVGDPSLDDLSQRRVAWDPERAQERPTPLPDRDGELLERRTSDGLFGGERERHWFHAGDRDARVRRLRDVGGTIGAPRQGSRNTPLTRRGCRCVRHAGSPPTSSRCGRAALRHVAAELAKDAACRARVRKRRLSDQRPLRRAVRARSVPGSSARKWSTQVRTAAVSER